MFSKGDRRGDERHRPFGERPQGHQQQDMKLASQDATGSKESALARVGGEPALGAFEHSDLARASLPLDVAEVSLFAVRLAADELDSGNRLSLLLSLLVKERVFADHLPSLLLARIDLLAKGG